MKSYVGLKGESSPQDKIFDCPADTFCYTPGDVPATAQADISIILTGIGRQNAEKSLRENLSTADF